MNSMIPTTNPCPRRRRRGMNLTEVLVVIAIIVAFLLIAIPLGWSFLRLDLRTAAKELAVNTELLHDEAMMLNRTVRLAFHLDEGYYTFEVGEPDVLIFNDPDQREAYESELASKMSRTRRSSDDTDVEVDEDGNALRSQAYTTGRKYELPSGTGFGGVYTPQYGEFLRPHDLDERDELEEDEKIVAYAYMFPNGFVEHTVIQLVELGREDRGYTLEIEPLSGKVHIDDGLHDHDERMRDYPDRGPELQ